jgi:peptidoglycan/xylan/chitin deacetylase (PgdA/CDA1 family)
VLVIVLVLCRPLAISENVNEIPVLIYHEIVIDGKQPSETIISLNDFSKQMQYLADNGYKPISISELVAFMKGYATYENPIVLTFDDGWKNTLKALPVLKKREYKASFFIITGAADGKFGSDYMTWTDIKKLAKNKNFEIGSHSVTHPWDPSDNLVTWVQGKNPGKGVENVRYELVESKEALEKHLNRDIDFLAWPNGWFNNNLIEIAREAGYKALLTTWEGMNIQNSDILKIKRYKVDGSKDMKHFIKMLQEF